MIDSCGCPQATSTDTSIPSPNPDSASRGMQPQHQPLNTFQPGPTTSTVSEPPSSQDNAELRSTPSRPLSFVPSVDHVTQNHPQVEEISEAGNIASSPVSQPETWGVDRKNQPSVLSREPDKFKPSLEEPGRPSESLEPSKKVFQASTNDRDSERPHEEAQDEKQSNPVVIGDAAPIFLHHTAEAESYLGSPKEVHSPHSTTSSNRTLTQADIPGPGSSNELRRSHVATTGPDEIPRVPTRGDQRTSQERRMVTEEKVRDPQSTRQPSGIRVVSAAIAAHGAPVQSASGTNGLEASNLIGSAEGSTRAWPPPNTKLEQPYSTIESAGTDSTSHTTQSSREGDAIQPQNVNSHGVPPTSVHIASQEPVYASDSGSQNTSVPARQGPTTVASEPSQQARRPFSFIEYSSKEPAHSSRDFKPREPSIDSRPEEVHQDRPPSPISPPLSLTKNNLDEYHEVPSNQYESDRDIVSVEDRSTPPNRHRSFSRPFKSPDIAQHPAFRQDHEPQSLTEASDLPTQFYPAQIGREEALLPRQQGTEYQLEGIGPPPVEPARSKSRSRRSSRNSGFFKNLGNSSKTEIPPVPTGVERQSAILPAPVSTSAAPATDKKSKRASLFRSLTGHNGSGSDRSRESITVQAPGSGTDLQLQSLPKSPSADEEDFPTRGKSKKLRNKLQRNSNAGATEQESGKKKRFSALGVSLA